MDEGLKQYMINLEATQRRDHADKEMIDQYTKLADRAIAAETRRRELEKEQRNTPLSESQTKGRMATPPIKVSSTPPSEAVAQLRTQLADAQKARALLEAQITTIPNLEADKAVQTRAIKMKDREIISLKRRIRDLEEELMETKKMGAEVQDDMITLTLQMNVAEEKAKNLQKENKDLVERWMTKMKEEADQMNERSQW